MKRSDKELEEFEVEVLDLVVSERITGNDFTEDILSEKEKLQKKKERKAEALLQLDREMKFLTGFSISDVIRIIDRPQNILDHAIKVKAQVIIQKYKA
jgi:hypothetical protein